MTHQYDIDKFISDMYADAFNMWADRQGRIEFIDDQKSGHFDIRFIRMACAATFKEDVNADICWM